MRTYDLSDREGAFEFVPKFLIRALGGKVSCVEPNLITDLVLRGVLSVAIRVLSLGSLDIGYKFSEGKVYISYFLNETVGSNAFIQFTGASVRG